MIGIYKITSPNNNVYIGQSVNIEKRFSKYRSGECVSQYALFRSLIKYGWINHRFEILEECLKNELNIRERYYQEFFDVTSKNGLNCHLVGADGKKQVLSTETIEKMSKKAKERVVSELKKKNHSEIMTGRKYSDEHKRKISIANKGKKHWWNIGKNQSDKQKKAVSDKLKKPISQYDLDGNLIKIWDSTKSARDFYNVGGSGISACLNGKNKTALGFIWKKVV